MVVSGRQILWITKLKHLYVRCHLFLLTFDCLFKVIDKNYLQQLFLRQIVSVSEQSFSQNFSVWFKKWMNLVPVQTSTEV